ncbi:MAG: hypothetical protein EXR58_07670 [Chloroflexi bacterium]|nr:hypothetical protein [Chloroflexota bacterium]
MTSPSQAVILVILGLATLLGWNFWRGRTGILPLYYVSVVILVALVIATGSQVLQLSGFIEPANAAAIYIALSACATNPTMWRQEVSKDLERTRLYAALRPRDFLSWRGWLKVVDRIGAVRAVLVYLALFLAGLVGTALTAQPTTVSLAPDRAPYVLVLAPVVLFALLSAWYLYLAARRLVPGA